PGRRRGARQLSGAAVEEPEESQGPQLGRGDRRIGPQRRVDDGRDRLRCVPGREAADGAHGCETTDRALRRESPDGAHGGETADGAFGCETADGDGHETVLRYPETLGRIEAGRVAEPCPADVSVGPSDVSVPPGRS